MATECPMCGSAATGGYALGDDTVIVCSQCSGYRLGGTAAKLLEIGTLPKPDVARFRELVKRKRGDSTDYPTITSDDLKSLS